MRFKKGDKVEVMNRAEVPISWRAAEIVSGNGHSCSVRYGSGSPMQSENIEERVSRKMIRPCPPVVQCVETWAPGDIVEVYNDCSWKVAIMLSILPRDRYLVRLLGCSLELSIHISGMRARQNWKDGKWIFIRKGCDQAGTQRSNKITAQDYNRKMKSQPLQLDAHTKVLGETDGLATEGKNRGQESCLISSRSLKRMSPYCTSGVDSLYGNAQKFQAIETDNRRQRAALVTLQEKVDAVAYPRGTLGEKYVHTSINTRSNGFNEFEREDLGGVIGFSPRRSLEPSDSDSDACSVGSCSVTSERPNELLGHLPRVSRRVSGGLCSDAESFCGSGPSGYKEKSHNNPPEEELATSVHRLELHAYRCTLVALYAYGPLTWEKEALLTDLRITLHISNDEHLMELKNLISSKGSYYIK
ncbi:PREDICTED: uncharacterized protein LOC109206006 isoform X1 [Nicotiana attenuata]|uniref:ENT domain-containing protein n=1 Tax=Nicotiana attenuata TaxID=49451 RepID=A0A314KW90_NICAT|nr:PREDICTED: uncharacterized protein LOC109206006 isoform X1 [Nicotiana attenuata]OIT33445.1 hypothetical protein A4A49_10807 [Nicotiana attenuata]